MNVLNWFVTAGVLKLRSMMVCLSLDPLAIIEGANDSSHDGGLENVQFNDDKKNIFELLELDALFYTLRRDLLLCAASVLALIVLKWMIAKSPQKVAAHKEEFFHKLTIVFVSASILTFLNLLYSFFSSIF